MIEFIVAELSSEIEEDIKRTISRVMKKSASPYQISFVHSKQEILPYIKKDVRKVYILDLYIKGITALDIARRIREEDWNSIIIILTAQLEYRYEFLTNRLMLFDYIWLGSQAYEHLASDITRIVAKEDQKKVLLIEDINSSYRIDFNQIIYITTDIASRKSIVVSSVNIVSTSLPLYKIKEMLPAYFLQVHRSYIVNMNQVAFVNFKEHTISFYDLDEKIWFSRRYAKIVKQKMNEDCQNW